MAQQTQLRPLYNYLSTKRLKGRNTMQTIPDPDMTTPVPAVLVRNPNPAMVTCSRINDLLRYTNVILILHTRDKGQFRVIEVIPLDKYWIRCYVESTAGFRTDFTVPWNTQFDFFLGAP